MSPQEWTRRFAEAQQRYSSNMAAGRESTDPKAASRFLSVAQGASREMSKLMRIRPEGARIPS